MQAGVWGDSKQGAAALKNLQVCSLFSLLVALIYLDLVH